MRPPPEVQLSWKKKKTHPLSSLSPSHPISFFFFPASSSSFFQNIEKKGVLSAVEKAGLLSKAEKAGLTLSSIEKLGLLSTAEKLGLLEAAEGALVTDPGKIAAASIAPLVGTILVLSVFPDDNAVLAILKYGLAAVLGGAFLTLFAGGFVVASLQE